MKNRIESFISHALMDVLLCFDIRPIWRLDCNVCSANGRYWLFEHPGRNGIIDTRSNV